MKFLKESLVSAAVLLVVLSIANAESVCHAGVKVACEDATGKKTLEPAKCTAQFGQFPHLNNQTEALIKEHLRASMEFLMIGNHFGEWNINRKGFFEYFQKLSDAAWEDAIDLMQHMVKRGGRLTNDFEIPEAEECTSKGNEAYKCYDMDELNALSKALDIQKSLARSTLRLITLANHAPVRVGEEIGEWPKGSQRDGEFAHYLADQVSDKQVMRIKDLANHVNSLSQALDATSDAGLVLYIYDTQVLN